MSEFSKRLKELRQQRNLTQRQLAELANIPQPTLARYEQGITEPGLTSLIKIADIFGVSLDSLTGRPEQLKLFE